MIGRGIFQNLWVFNNQREIHSIPQNEKMHMLIEHIQLFEKTWGNDKPLEILKKFYKVYVSDIPNAQNIRIELMELKTAEETIRYITSKLLKQ